MKKLTLSEYASIAEIIAAVVIILSLVYVGQELDQNTNAIQQTSYQSAVNTLTEGDYLVASDPDLNRIVTTAEKNPELLNEEEWSRFSRYATPRIGAWEYMFLAYQTNSVSKPQWEGALPYFEYLICNIGYRTFFEANPMTYNPEFVLFVNERIKACH